MQKITLIIWPSALALAAGAGFGNSTLNFKLFMLALAANVILYGLLGVGVWLGLRKHVAFLVFTLGLVIAIWWRLLSLN